MAQAIAAPGRAGTRPYLGLVLATIVLAALATVTDLTVGTGAWFFAIAGVIGLILIAGRPEFGIALFLATFLIDLRFAPVALQGAGLLTVNNVLGMLFLVLLAQRMYVTGDWSFIWNREILLMAFIALCYYASAAFNGPEPRLLELIATPEIKPDSARLFLNRMAFVVFFISFIRTPAHIRMVYLLAIGMMVVSSFIGVWGVLQGGGAYGYRASTEQSVIAQAWNPNRLAMLSIISLSSLWYVMQQARSGLVRAAIIAIMPVLTLAVFMAGSRSGLLGLAVCIGFIVFERGINVRKTIGVALGAAAALSLVVRFVPEKTLERSMNLPGTAAAATGVGSGSLERRQYAFEIGYEIIKENPLLGVGVGNWEITRFLHDPSRSTGAPHSSYILAAAEGGVFCVLAYLALFWRTWQNLNIANQLLPPARGLRDMHWIVNGARAGLVTLVTFSLVADLWQFIVVFWLIALGVVLRRYSQARYGYVVA